MASWVQAFLGHAYGSPGRIGLLHRLGPLPARLAVEDDAGANASAKRDDGKTHVVLRNPAPDDDNAPGDELTVSRRHVATVRRRLKGG